MNSIQLIDPPWLVYARTQIGVKEIVGPKHESKILQWWKDIRRGGIKDDETPWCSAFCGACFERVGFVSSRFEGASSWLKWGQEVSAPWYGCVVVLKRPGGHHVGILVGQSEGGNEVGILGGNQKNQVSIELFPKDLIMKGGMRWPVNYPLPEFFHLPVVKAVRSTTQA